MEKLKQLMRALIQRFANSLTGRAAQVWEVGFGQGGGKYSWEDQLDSFLNEGSITEFPRDPSDQKVLVHALTRYFMARLIFTPPGTDPTKILFSAIALQREFGKLFAAWLEQTS
jgi:hypothetical protein